MENMDDLLIADDRPFNAKRDVRRACLECGAEFQVKTQRPGQKTCSNACRYKHQTGRLKPHWSLVTKRCVVCDGEFTRQKHLSHQVTCGTTCSGIYRRKLETRKCAFCEKNYECRPSCKTTCCSKVCGRAIRTAENHSSWKTPVMKPCVMCGSEFDVSKGWKKSKKHCSRECYKEFRIEHGGTRALKVGSVSQYADGYRYVKVESGAWIPEHRIIAEQMIERKLKRYELVHHRNGKPSDNRPENLQVMTATEHMKLHLHAEKIGLLVLSGEMKIYDPLLREVPLEGRVN